MSARTNRAAIVPLLALLGLSACADSTLTSKGAGGTGAQSREKSDAGELDASTTDAGRRVKERTVSIELPAIATREVSMGPDGDPVYGEFVPLEGADVCVVKRRAAYAAFEPFTALEKPVCAKSSAGKTVLVKGAPASSDLLITVEYEGLTPFSLTRRTSDNDAGAEWAPIFSIVLLKPGAFDPWLEPAPPVSKGHGLLYFGVALEWSGPGMARPELLPSPDRDIFFGHYAWTFAANVRMTIHPAGDDQTIEETTLDRLQGMTLPEGSARLSLANDNEHLSCAPFGDMIGLDAGDGNLEVPVLAGYAQFLGIVCRCGGNSERDELIDLSTCSIAPAGDDMDAGR